MEVRKSSSRASTMAKRATATSSSREAHRSSTIRRGKTTSMRPMTAPAAFRSERWNAAGAVIGRIDVVFPLRIVELRCASLDDDVAVALFAVVDARLVDFRTSVCNRRNIPQIEERQSFGALAGDRAHHRAIAVSKQHVAVDPCLGV